tara:strand:- start:6702 stop:7010 length:309 start_codon:yes stop_codon:yes gene_type:complete
MSTTMNATKEPIYVEGLRFFNPRETAPDFVKGEIIVNLKQFVDFLATQEENYTKYEGNNQLKIVMKTGKSGGMYFEVDTFKPNSGAAAPQKVAVTTADNLPF